MFLKAQFASHVKGRGHSSEDSKNPQQAPEVSLYFFFPQIEQRTRGCSNSNSTPSDCARSIVINALYRDVDLRARLHTGTPCQLEEELLNKKNKNERFFPPLEGFAGDGDVMF
ncbi:hypothetical protein EYF80_028546 [Liparis tanakae]|uniref:Uncharacterized protein n=1 Tax=Liparis tanakae TaxID=230148 RepID=A0A4Z2H6K7_9TELE|nr:hypothetical protein EYF80_028546 [Liparis tanakae]